LCFIKSSLEVVGRGRGNIEETGGRRPRRRLPQLSRQFIFVPGDKEEEPGEELRSG
jgi:hypothetical protein